MSRNLDIAFKAAAALLGLAAYWAPFARVIGYCSTGSYSHMAQAAALVLLGLAAGLLRSKSLMLAARIGFVAGWMFDLLLSVNFPQTFHCSHQLLPLELAMLAAFVMITTWAGGVMGRLASRKWGEAERPSARGVGAALMAAALLAVVLSPNLLPLQLEHQERRALERLQALAEVQMRYRSAHPREGFTCDLSSLDPTIGSTTKYVIDGRTSQNIFSRGYRYRLICMQDAVPMTDFRLEATPVCSPDCGNVQYCIDATGVVKQLAVQPKGNDCERDGTPVASVPRH